MLKSEYKVLKYINRHEPVTRKELDKRFKKYNLDNILPYIDPYLSIKKLQEETWGNIPTGNYLHTDETEYRISHSGQELIERKRHEFWAFFFPYVITTLIAICSVVAQIAELLT